MQVFNSMKGVAQDIKSAAVNPANIKDAKRLGNVCKVAKIAAVAMAIVSVALAVFTGPIGFLFAAPVALAMYDAYRMADNIQKIADKKQAGSEIPTPMTANDIANNIGRGTILAKPILGLTLQKAYA